MVLLLLFCVLWVCQVKAFSYVAPEECQWGFANPDGEDVGLVCRLQSLGGENYWNFSAIPSDHTSSLRVVCSETSRHNSQIANNSLDHLVQLRDLHIEQCQLTVLPTLAFAGLQNLRNLTVRTYNNALNLQLQENVFAPLRQLERLDVGYNAIWTLPLRVFCVLSNLLTLNLTNNNLQDVHQLGVGSANDENCQLGVVKELDLSNNQLRVLPSGSFAKMPSLRQLLVQDNQISLIANQLC